MAAEATASVQEVHSPQLGRHLVAREAAPVAGTVLLRQRPYAAVLYDDQVPGRCDYCFSAADGVARRCSRSRWAHYCCQGHQRAAWRAYYRHECAALLACAPNVPPASVRLAARVLWRRASEAGGQQQQQQQQQQHEAGGSYADVERLQSHWDDLDDGRKVLYAQMAALTRQYMQGAGQAPEQQEQEQQEQQLPGVREIAQLLARFACNNHTVCDEELRPIGVGLYPLGALVNHSCRPSCAQSFADGACIVFRSLAPMARGEQLTISYVELAATRQERRRQLLGQYFFDVDAEAAAAAAAAGGQAAAEPVRLQLRLQPALLLEGRRQLLPQGGGEERAAAAQAAAQLSIYAGRRTPPWPEDRPDGQLCEMLLVPPPPPPLQDAAAAAAGAARPADSGSQRAAQLSKLPGGMCLLQEQADGEGGEKGTAAGLFAELEGLELFAGRAATAVGQMGADGSAAAAESAAAARAGSDTAPVGGSARSAASSPPQQQQQQQHLEVVQWGDWGQAAQAPGSGAAADTCALAAAAACVLLEVWGLQQAAEAMAAGGQAVAALHVYQRALALADGAAPAMPGAAAVAAPADEGEEGQSPLPPHQQGGGSGGGTAGGGCAAPGFVLGPRHITRARLNAGLLKAAVDEGGSWPVALAAARALAPVYELVYPKVWPNLGLHYALLAKLELLLEHPDNAARAAAAAASVLRVTHGGGSPALREALRVQHEAQQELAALAGTLA